MDPSKLSPEEYQVLVQKARKFFAKREGVIRSRAARGQGQGHFITPEERKRLQSLEERLGYLTNQKEDLEREINKLRNLRNRIQDVVRLREEQWWEVNLDEVAKEMW